MSLTVQQLLSDAKRLTGRLRDHDSAADTIISSAQDVLKEVEAMRQYQEDIESLNTIAHNRPRAQLVLGKIIISFFTILKKKKKKEINDINDQFMIYFGGFHRFDCFLT